MSDWKTLFAEVVQPAVARSKVLKSLEVGRGMLKDSGRILRQDFDGDDIVVFADEAGFGAAGDGFRRECRARPDSPCARISFPAHPRPKASVELARSFEPLLAGATPFRWRSDPG